MSESPPKPQQSMFSANAKTILFMVVLSFVCALVLSILASALAEPKQVAKNLYRSKQMMIAAKILDHHGHFLIQNGEGQYVPAQYAKDGILEPAQREVIATNGELLEVYKFRLIPMLTNNRGELTTFAKAGINESDYINSNKKTGYSKLPWKLVYAIKKNPSSEAQPVEGKENIEGYVIPVNGFGLWDAIYGYLAVETDGNTIIGTTWYDQKETPGLGANIADASWQKQFQDKHLFQESNDGTTNFKTAPLGIVVVKGKVSEVLGSSPKAKSAVDGMAGATLTGNGVTDAYKDILAAYRPFLIKLHDANANKQ